MIMKVIYAFARFVMCVSCLILSTSILSAQPNEAFDIYRVNVKTGAVHQVTNLPLYGVYNPSFSTNGKLIVHDVLVGNPFFHGLGITNVKTGVSIFLAGSEGGNDASWSPSGHEIIFDRFPFGDLSLYLVSPQGGTPSLAREYAIDADWGPNGQSIVFTDTYDGSLKTINLYTGEEFTVVPFGQNGTWSPNGRMIAYTNGNDLFKIRVNHRGQPIGSPVQLTFDGPDVYNQQPSWSNNSKTIVFHSNRVVNDFDIWRISASGGMPIRLTGLIGNGDYDPDYSKNGRWVAYAGVSPILSMESYTTLGSDNKLSNPEIVFAQSFPNPFRESTVIRFEVNQPSWIEIQILNSNGALVNKLIAQQYDTGTYQVKWDGQDDRGIDLDSGMYTYYVISDQSRVSGKLIKIRN
jgi:Tol biopolymer transport system component